MASEPKKRVRKPSGATKHPGNFSGPRGLGSEQPLRTHARAISSSSLWLRAGGNVLAPLVSFRSSSAKQDEKHRSRHDGSRWCWLGRDRVNEPRRCSCAEVFAGEGGHATGCARRRRRHSYCRRVRLLHGDLEGCSLKCAAARCQVLDSEVQRAPPRTLYSCFLVPAWGSRSK
jgi:hypothetical protein